MSKKLNGVFASIVGLFAVIYFMTSVYSPSVYGAAYAGSGDGTSNSPYKISTADQLDEVRNYLNDPNVYFELANDIDLSDYTDWTPIGDDDDPFLGHFDGNGYVIRHLNVNNVDPPYRTQYSGLFGLSDGIIENVRLESVHVTGDYYVGSLVGQNEGMIKNADVSGYVTGVRDTGGLTGVNLGTIESSHSSANVEGNSAYNYAGGLVGRLGESTYDFNKYEMIYVSGTIKTSSASGNVRDTDSIGGLVGGVESGDITQSFATGEINGSFEVGGLVGVLSKGAITQSYATGNVSGSYKIGGLVGHNNDTIQQSYAVGDTTATQPYAGGLIGENFGTVVETYSVGNVNGNEVKDWGKGGLIGENHLDDSQVSASFWDMNTSGYSTSNGGEGKTTAELADQNTYDTAGWNETVWDWLPGQYPKLKAIAQDDNFDVMAPSKPTVNMNGDTYTNPVTISLSGELGAEIYYTLDESNPTNASNVYTSPIDISSPSTLKAVQVDGAGNQSEVLEETYTFLHNVTFDTNGGSDVSRQSIEYNNVVVEPDAPTKTGFTFDGWYSDPDFNEKWNFDADTVTDDITLYAKWTINSYLVSFDSNDGSAVDSQSVDYNQLVPEPDQPTKTGFIFGGWYSDPDFNNGWNFDSDTVTDDTTLYAKWTINSYLVSFDSNDGSAVDAQSVDYNQSVPEPDDPTKTGFTFDGWYSDPEFNNAWEFDSDTVTDDTTLYAKWTINSYLVSFDSNDGSAVDAQSVDYNQLVAEPDQPTKTGFTFGGWYSDPDFNNSWDFDADTVTDNTTLYAKWMINSYLVSFDSNDGSAVDAQSVDYNQLVAEPEQPIKLGFTFDGWYSDPDFNNAWDFDTDMVTDDITLYAKWTINSYLVNFDSNDGSAVDAQSVDYNQLVAEPDHPTKTGFTFGGWYSDQDFNEKWDFDSDTVTDDTTLYAKWIGNNATLRELTISDGILDTAFDPYHTDYSIEVAHDVEEIQVTATAIQDNAKILVDKQSVDNAIPSHSVPLSAGINSIVVTVTAEDGTENKYKLKVTRLADTLTVVPDLIDGYLSLSNDSFILHENGTLIIDIPENLSSTEQLKLTSEQLEHLLNRNVTIVVQKGPVRLEIPAHIFNTDNELILTVEQLEDLDLPHAKEAASNIYDFTLEQNGTEIHQFDDSISMYFSLPESERTNGLQVYYWNENDEQWEALGGSFEDGEVKTSTNHFSIFAVFHESIFNEDTSQPNQDEMTDENSEELPNTASSMYSWLLVGIIILAIGIVLVYLSKRKYDM
ncbi:InlB B-repeat-containing protein [Radiobacillus sp. PE A8.2]|uniref:InlB B-repeat-containing protein n=1 Tax=Radiobacillus sp. PE A8.2 TaxID=3380349 RepID=UPI00388F3A28